MYYIKLSAILFLICAVAAGILAYVNGITDPRIRKIQEEKETATRAELIPEADFPEVKGTLDTTFVYQRAIDKKSGELKGYTFVASRSGYSSVIKTMVGVDTLFNVIAIRVIDQKETPGLGANCTAEKFTDQFKERDISRLVLDKDGGGEGAVVSIAGSTITTRAITSSIRITLEKLQAEIKAAQGGEQ